MKKQRTSPYVLLGFVCIVAFLFWKAPQGHCSPDEAFYLVTPYRLWQGDALFTDEWHIAMLSSVLLYLPMKLYMAVMPGTDGIILHFRYVYIAVHTTSSLAIYGLLRKKHPLAAFLGSAAYLLFVPYNLMALSYNTMRQMFFTLAVLIPAVKDDLSPHITVLCGLFFAATVLCCPYLVLGYAAFGVVALFFRIRRKQTDILRYFLWFSLGCAIAAAAFLGFVLRRCSVGQIIENLPYILADPEHGDPIIAWIPRFLKFWFFNVPASIVPMAGFIMLMATSRTAFARRHRELYFLCGLGLAILYTGLFMAFDRLTNCLMVPISLFGMLCALLPEKYDKRGLWLVYLPTLIHAFAISVTSNQQFHALSAVFCTTVCYCFLSIFGCMDELDFHLSTGRRLRRFGILALCALFFATMLLLRTKQTFVGGSVTQITARVTCGPEKGLHVNPNHADYYHRVYADTAPIRNEKSGNVLYYSEQCWYYLADPKPLGTHSGYLVGIWGHLELPVLQSYYDMNPMKKPQYIYLDRKTHLTPAKVLGTLGMEGEIQENLTGWLIYIK